MTLTRYEPQSLEEYRQKVSEVAKLRGILDDTIGRLEPEKVKKTFDEFTLRAREMETLRSSLGATGVFLAKYGVEIVNDHTVSFVVPRGCSRIGMLQEAEELIRVRDEKELINPDMLLTWSKIDGFVGQSTSSEHICIDGRVEGSAGKFKSEQFKLLTDQGLQIATEEELALAFALYWVASGKSLFGRLQTSAHSSHGIIIARHATRALCYLNSLGLDPVEDLDVSATHIVMSARIPLAMIGKGGR